MIAVYIRTAEHVNGCILMDFYLQFTSTLHKQHSDYISKLQALRALPEHELLEKQHRMSLRTFFI